MSKSKKKTVKKGSKTKTRTAKGKPSAKDSSAPEVDDAAWSRMRQKTRRKNKGGGWFKFPKGETTIRIIPFKHDGDVQWFVEYDSHWVNSKKRGFRCTEDDDCPLCGLNKKDYNPRTERLANFIVRNPDGEDKLVTARLPAGVFNDVWDMIMEDKKHGKRFLSNKNGLDIVVTNDGRKSHDSYSARADLDACPWGMDVKPVNLFEMIEGPRMKVNLEELEAIAEEVADDEE